MRRRALFHPPVYWGEQVSPKVDPLGYQVKLFDKLICGCSKIFIVFPKRGESIVSKSGAQCLDIYFWRLLMVDQSSNDMVKLLRVYGECLGAERR